MIADGQASLRAALYDIVVGCGELDLVAVAMDIDEALEMLRLRHPDVMVVDAKIRCGGAPRLVRMLQSISPGTGVVVLSAHEDDGLRTLLTDGFAVEFLVRGVVTPEQIRAAIRRAAAAGAPRVPLLLPALPPVPGGSPSTRNDDGLDRTSESSVSPGAAGARTPCRRGREPAGR